LVDVLVEAAHDLDDLGLRLRRRELLCELQQHATRSLTLLDHRLGRNRRPARPLLTCRRGLLGSLLLPAAPTGRRRGGVPSPVPTFRATHRKHVPRMKLLKCLFRDRFIRSLGDPVKFAGAKLRVLPKLLPHSVEYLLITLRHHS